MNLSSVIKPSILVSIGVPVAILGFWQGNQVISFSAFSTVCLGLISEWLNSEPQKIKENSQLPKEATKKLSNSLHHSQIPLLEQVIQPIMAEEFDRLQSQKIGETLAGRDITLFDDKIKKLSDAFTSLKASRIFYQKRTLDDRDRAITLLTFLAIFFEEEADEKNLGCIYKKIPPQAFKMLRKQVYRLFDLTHLLLEKRLVINSELSKTFSDLSLFNRYDYSSSGKVTPTLCESKPTLLASLPDTENVTSLDNSSEMQDLPSCKTQLCESSQLDNEPEIIQSPSPQETIDEVGQEDSTTNQEIIKETTLTSNSKSQDLISDFINWLEKRIASGNRQFSIESQSLVVTNPEKYGYSQVFVLPDVFGKYQSRSGIEAEVIKKALWDTSVLKNSVFLENGANFIELTPCELNKPFESQASSQIKEGESTCVQP